MNKMRMPQVFLSPLCRVAPRATTRVTAAPILAAPRYLYQHRGLRSLAELSGDLQSQKSQAMSEARNQAEESKSTIDQTGKTDIPGASSPLNVPGRATKRSVSASSASSTVRDWQSLVLTLSCPDTRGIVHRVTGWLASRHFDIRDSAQYGDPDTGKFFMRVHASGPPGRVVDIEQGMSEEFRRDVGEEMQMHFEIRDEDVKPRTMLMVSKIGRECLSGC